MEWNEGGMEPRPYRMHNGLGIPSKVVKVANSYQMVDQVSHNLKLEMKKTGRN